MRGKRFRQQLHRHHRRQSYHGGQRRPQVVRRHAELAGMRRQRLVISRRMLDGMRPRQQLGEEKDGNEKEMTQRIHDGGLIDLDE